MAITRKTWYGIAKESTPGTLITTPTMFLPKKGDLKFDRKPEYDTSERGSRDTNWSVNYTSRKGTCDFKGFFFADSSPYMLLGAFGSVVSTQPDSVNVPTVHLHTFGLTDAVPSFTIFKNLDTQVWQMGMSYVEKFTIKLVVESKLMEMDSSMMGLFPVKYTGSAITPTFSAVKPIPGYAATVTVGGSATYDVSEMSIEYSQKVVPWYSANGSPDVASYYVTERSAKFDMTLRYEGSGITVFDKYLGFSTGNVPQDDTLNVSIQGALLGSHSSTNYNENLTIGFPVVNYDTVEPDLGKEIVMLKVKGTVRPSSGSPLLTATVQNLVTGYTS